VGPDYFVGHGHGKSMSSRTIARYWLVEQTFAAASGLPSYRAFEVGVVGWRSY
jgi:hypothetical protein